MKDMHPPADEQVCLRLGHVEKDRERLRLQRQRKTFHDLDRVGREALRQQSVGDILHPRHERRLLRPEKKRLDELAIVGLIGRIDLNGQLPDAAEAFLRRDRHPEWRVRAEGLPVLRRPADVRVPQDHRNHFVAGRQTEHARGTALLAKWVGDLTLGDLTHGWKDITQARRPLRGGKSAENNST